MEDQNYYNQNYYVALEDDKVFMEVPIFVGSDLVGYNRQLVMTKDMFIRCYEKWILNNDKEATELG